MQPDTSSDTADLADLLIAALVPVLTADQRAWFGDALARARGGDANGRFLGDYVGATRRLSTVATSDRDAIATIETGGLAAGVALWPAPRIARAALLLTAATALTEERCAALVDETFRTGDSDERVALLGVLAMLPRPESHVDTAVEACRSNVVTVFEAVACENPYPGRYFPDLSFNQMVLKALFLGVALSRIVGLDQRRSQELARMAADYAAERKAAGRAVPADIDLAMGSVENST